MSNNFYEDTLLKEEFHLVALLQQDNEFRKYVTIFYEDRITGNKNHVSVRPAGSRYPEIYIVEYKMPVYISRGRLREDWEGTVTITLSETMLMDKHVDNLPGVTFHNNFSPFNNHIHDNRICAGNAWAVAKDNGIWHFIISIGALINQDGFVCAEGRHFNGAAYEYWVSRGRQPVTNIKWPLDLLNKPIPFIEKKPAKSLNITAKPSVGLTTMPQTSPAIDIKPKEKPPVPKFNFVLVKN